MVPTPEGLKKASEATAKGATTNISKVGATTTKLNAGAGASTVTKSAAKPGNGSSPAATTKPANGGSPAAAAKPKNRGGPATAAKPAASTPSSSKAGAATTSMSRNDPTTDAVPDWKALRAKVAENSPKTQGEVITGDPVALLRFLRARQNEQALTTYAAYPKKSVGLDKKK